MYDKERCGDCESRLRCLTGEQWLCTKTDTSLYINVNQTTPQTTLAIDGDVKIRGRSLEDIIDERIANSKFSWRKLLKRWL